ncbi:LytR/AlgR family response regulator transcription factor [Roseivirga sp. BDSF3-8]|uniref:LytR/AlgR family response regulator transcription factor n=1 Tax=Roseivirga sp. BDSF3-8 TaxID=3241598 RepID=UPI0035317EAF
MNAIIIEDEPHQRELLEGLLSRHHPEVCCMGAATGVQGGLDLITRMRPDLVFMDVMLADGTCFDLLAQLPERPFEIIFTTSHQEYAVKAFRLAAVDYLLKPVAQDELAAAIAKLKEKQADRQAFDHIRLLLGNMQKETRKEQPRIALPTLTGFTMVAIEDIVWCESDNTYTTFYLREGKDILVSRTLKACEKLLADHAFYRVHNSALVNLNYIREYVKGEGGYVVMINGAEVNVSRRRKDEFLRLFQKVKL